VPGAQVVERDESVTIAMPSATHEPRSVQFLLRQLSCRASLLWLCTVKAYSLQRLDVGVLQVLHIRVQV